MPEKRPREDIDSTGPAKKSKYGAERRSKGFQVGPANLPDGTHKRKVQQIKKDLIHKAKIKKEYAKIKERELANQPQKPQVVDDTDPAHQEASAPETSLDPNPNRQALVDAKQSEPQGGQPAHERRKRKPKTTPFTKEAGVAQKRKEEAEARQKAREEAEKQHQQRITDRERMKRAMAKAYKLGRDGKKKLGREAPVLLKKVKRLVNNS
ncbi:uncharacterized protein IWZ02DRAFT_491787 [Phyllosticta citriasiana]|uniref:uncharacterized protein n=1 Tax=Phyllosticta citriasiana TaxID=595635 RepID=UPI0030FD2643